MIYEENPPCGLSEFRTNSSDRNLVSQSCENQLEKLESSRKGSKKMISIKH